MVVLCFYRVQYVLRFLNIDCAPYFSCLFGGLSERIVSVYSSWF